MTKEEVLCSDGTLAHHWIIDSDYKGRCIKLNCYATKDFTPKKISKPRYRPRVYTQSVGCISTVRLPHSTFNYNNNYIGSLLELMEECSGKTTNCESMPCYQECWQWWQKIVTHSVCNAISTNLYEKYKTKFYQIQQKGLKSEKNRSKKKNAIKVI